MSTAVPAWYNLWPYITNKHFPLAAWPRQSYHWRPNEKNEWLDKNFMCLLVNMGAIANAVKSWGWNLSMWEMKVHEKMWLQLHLHATSMDLCLWHHIFLPLSCPMYCLSLLISFLAKTSQCKNGAFVIEDCIHHAALVLMETLLLHHSHNSHYSGPTVF